MFAIEAQWDDRAIVERDDRHVQRIDIVYVRSGTSGGQLESPGWYYVLSD